MNGTLNYTFENQSSHQVKLTFLYEGPQSNPVSDVSMPPRTSQCWEVAPDVPHIGVTKDSGVWKNFTGGILYMGGQPFDAAPGTYIIIDRPNDPPPPPPTAPPHHGPDSPPSTDFGTIGVLHVAIFNHSKDVITLIVNVAGQTEQSKVGPNDWRLFIFDRIPHLAARNGKLRIFKNIASSAPIFDLTCDWGGGPPEYTKFENLHRYIVENSGSDGFKLNGPYPAQK